MSLFKKYHPQWKPGRVAKPPHPLFNVGDHRWECSKRYLKSTISVQNRLLTKVRSKNMLWARWRRFITSVQVERCILRFCWFCQGRIKYGMSHLFKKLHIWCHDAIFITCIPTHKGNTFFKFAKTQANNYTSVVFRRAKNPCSSMGARLIACIFSGHRAGHLGRPSKRPSKNTYTKRLCFAKAKSCKKRLTHKL